MDYSAEERALLVKIGRMGGYTRAKKLTAERRKEIALNAIQTRWKRVRDAQAQALADVKALADKRDEEQRR